jgi:hypothetical protein
MARVLVVNLLVVVGLALLMSFSRSAWLGATLGVKEEEAEQEDARDQQLGQDVLVECIRRKAKRQHKEAGAKKPSLDIRKFIERRRAVEPLERRRAHR